MMYSQIGPEKRSEEPISVAIIGTGIFGKFVTDQVEELPHIKPVILADIEVSKAETAFQNAGVDPDSVVRTDDPDEVDEILRQNKRVVTKSGVVAAEAPVDVVVEITGAPEAAARHIWSAIASENNVVNVTVETDATVGPLLSQFASQNGVTYSMAYGDEPAQVISLVEWARAVGLDIVAAGQGTIFDLEPYGTPDDALKRYGLSDSFIENNDPNPRMYNTFLDGTKVSVELCAAANAVGFSPDGGEPHIPKSEPQNVIETLRPKEDGGVLDTKGVVDGVTPIEQSSNPSAFIVTEAKNEHLQQYFEQRFNVPTTNDGKYQYFDRSYHIFPETTVSIANVALNDTPTGIVRTQTSEVIARAKRDLEPGETIEGGGGSRIYGNLESAKKAAANDSVPFELLAGAEVARPINKDDRITKEDVEIDKDSFLYHLRQIQNEVL